MNVCVVRNVVAVVFEWRRIKRQKPYSRDAKVLEIIQFLGQPAEVADAVVIAVVKRTDVQFVNDRILVDRMKLQTLIGLQHRILLSNLVYCRYEWPKTRRIMKVAMLDLIFLRIQILLASRFPRYVFPEFVSGPINAVICP